MLSRDQPNDEPFESRDLELGAAMLSWTDAHSSSIGVNLQGPLDAPGMDPTWLLNISGEDLEAEVVVFYGPYVDVSAYRPTRLEELYLGGEQDITASRIVEMLDELVAMNHGAVTPTWLRLAPGS